MQVSESELRAACQRFLDGLELDAVGFADALISMACKSGAITVVSRGSDDALRLTAGAEKATCAVVGAEGKLRSVCARLAVVMTTDGSDPPFYGAMGYLTADGSECRLLLEFNNRAGDVWLTLRRAS